MAQTEIDEIVNVIKSETALNSEAYNSTLADINNKLEDIANDGINTEQIKNSLKDLEVTLESRHRFMSEKFSDLKESFEILNENSELLTKNADLKIMFNLLNEHIDHFAQEINDQRNLSLEIESKLIEFKNDNSKKEEIIENISIVKEGVENINRGLEASVMEINSSLRGITKTLMTMDVTDQNDIIKRELENIYLATNAILSSMEILDQKNDEIAKNQITKDDLISLAGKFDNSLALVSEKITDLDKSDKIISEIEKNRNELLSFNENISKGLSDYLNSVRDVLANCIDEIKSAHAQNSDEETYIPMEKLENLEKLSDDIKKIDTTISSQSENYLTLISSKIKELGDTLDGFKSEITSSNIQTANDFTGKFEELKGKISDFPEIFNSRFEELQQKVDSSMLSVENFAQDSNLKLGNTLSEITDIRSDILNIIEDINNLGANQDLFTAHIDGKFNENLTELKDNLNLFEGGFEKLRHDIEQSNLDSRSILSEIAEKTAIQINSLISSLQEENKTSEVLNEIKSGFENVTTNLSDLRNIFTEISAKNVGNILTAITENTDTLNHLESRVNETISNSLNNSQSVIVSAIEENKQLIEDLNNHFMSLSEQNAGNILSGIENASAKIDEIKDNISSNFGGNLDNIHQTVSEIKDETRQQIENLSDRFTTLSEQNAGNIISSIESNSAKIDEIKDNISSNFGGNFENIQQTVSEIKDETRQQIENLSDRFTTLSEQNAGNILSGIENASAKIDEIKDNISANFGGNFNIIQQTVSEIKDETRQQIENLNERFTALSEQNAGNILSGIENASAKIDEIKDNISANFGGNFNIIQQTVSEIKDETRQQIENLNERFTALSEQNAGNILSGIENASAKIDEIKDNISANFGGNFDNIQQTVSEIKDETKQHIENLSDRFTTLSEQNAGNILSGIENASAKIDEIKDNISANFGGNFNNIQQTVSEIKDETKQQIESLSEKFANLTEQNISGINSTALKIDMLGVDLSTEIDNSFEMVKNHLQKTTDTQTQQSEKIGTLSENIAKLESEFSQNSDKFKSAVDEQINSLENYITALKETIIKTSSSENFEELSEKMHTIETALHDASDNFSDNLMMLQNKVMDYENSVNNLSAQTTEKLDSTISEICAIKEDFTNAIANISNSNEDVSELTTSLIQKFEEITIKNADENQIQNTLTIMEEKLEKLQELLTRNSLDNFDNIDNKISDLKQEIELVKTDISEILTTKNESIAGELTPLKEAIDNFTNTGFDNILENIKSQIELSYLNFSSDVNESLTENHDNYLHLNEAYEDLIGKFTKVEELIQNLNTNVTEQITSNLEKSNGIFDNWAHDIKTLKERTDSGFETTEKTLDGILRHLSVLAKNNSEVNLKDLKNQFLSKFDYFDSEVTSKLKVINDELDTGRQSSTEALSNLKSILDNLNTLNEKVDIIALSDSSEVMDNVIELTHSSERLEDLMQSLHEKVDILASSGETEKVEEMLGALHEKIDLIVTDGSDEKLDQIEDIIQTLHDKIDVFTMTDNEERIEDLVKSLHDKVDVLALSEDNDLVDEIQDIKEMIFEQRKQFEKSGLGDRTQSIDKCLEKLLSDLSTVEERITGLDLEKNASDIKDSVMNAILAVADQITFAEETEEIKGFVEERTEEINKNLLEVKKQLNNIASSSESWDYTYTMQDIESDIAKLRLILNDISASSSKEDISEISQNMHKIAASVNSLHSSLTEEQILDLKSNIEKINEDVLSLSSRTNKLLLTSDESYKALTDGLDEFSKISNQLQKRIDILDNSSINEIIEKKLDTITDAVTTSANADEVIRQVMMYLGEWIDDASEKLNNITEDTSNVPAISSEITLLKSMVNNTEVLDSIEKKFNEQQNRIDELEQKLDSVFNTIQHTTEQNSAFEDKMKNILDEKLDKIDEKMKKLDDKLTKLSKGIEKLASYVDED